MASVNQAEATATMTGQEESDEAEESTEITKDQLFHILQNERRRQVLRYVVNREGPFEMRTIAEQVAAWEHDTTVRELTSDQRQRVYIALYQSHLSKLDEVGLIEYQQSRGIVEVTDRIDVVKPHIEGGDSEVADEAEAESTATGPATFMTGGNGAGNGEAYYASAALASLALTGGVWANVLPSAILGTVGLALAVTIIFTATAFVHLRSEQSAAAE